MKAGARPHCHHTPKQPLQCLARMSLQLIIPHTNNHRFQNSAELLQALLLFLLQWILSGYRHVNHRKNFCQHPCDPHSRGFPPWLGSNQTAPPTRSPSSHSLPMLLLSPSVSRLFCIRCVAPTAHCQLLSELAPKGWNVAMRFSSLLH